MLPQSRFIIVTYSSFYFLFLSNTDIIERHHAYKDYKTTQTRMFMYNERTDQGLIKRRIFHSAQCRVLTELRSDYTERYAITLETVAVLSLTHPQPDNIQHNAGLKLLIRPMKEIKVNHDCLFHNTHFTPNYVNLQKLLNNKNVNESFSQHNCRTT